MLLKILVFKHYGLCAVPFNHSKYLVKWSEALKSWVVFLQPRRLSSPRTDVSKENSPLKRHKMYLGFNLR